MPSDKFIAYYCVNGGRKDRKRPGLEVQRAAVMSFLNRGHWTLLERHTEDVRPGAGARPVLADALEACRAHNAALVVADPERLERDDRFMAAVRKAGVECWAVEAVPAGLASAKPLGGGADRVH